MKSQHRHELKTNELAEWLANLPEWVRENARTIVYVSIIAVLVVAVALYYWRVRDAEATRKQVELTNLISEMAQSPSQIIQSQAQGFDTSFNLLPLSQNLQLAAGNAKNDQVAALALIKSAQAIRMELHYRPEVVSPQETATQIQKAKESYTEALQKAGIGPSLKAVAKFGLGLCEEELRNFDQAEKIYRQITEDSSLDGTTAAVQAKRRLETMADYKQEVVFFTPPPKPPAPKATQPLVKPADTNAPAPAATQPQVRLKPPEANTALVELAKPQARLTPLDSNTPSTTPSNVAAHPNSLPDR